MKLLLVVCLGSLLAWLPVKAQTLDDLLLITEEYAPLNFKRGGRVQGIAVDALVEMLRVAGSGQTREDIQVWPWARAYRTVQVRENTLLFAMSRTAEREEQFRWVGPFMTTRMSLLAKKDRDFRLASLAELNTTQYLVGAVRDDVAEQLLLTGGLAQERIYPGNAGANVARMLSADRVDFWAYGNLVALWTLRELGLKTADYEEVLVLMETEQYFALHRDTSDAVVRQLQDALQVIKDDGRLEAIIARYLE